MFDADEYPKAGVEASKLAKLRPAFNKEGSVTAANASGINDGAAGCIVASQSAIDKFGLTPLAKIVAYSSAGVDPAIMGTGPIPAVQQCTTTPLYSTILKLSSQLVGLQVSPKLDGAWATWI